MTIRQRIRKNGKVIPNSLYQKTNISRNKKRILVSSLLWGSLLLLIIGTKPYQGITIATFFILLAGSLVVTLSNILNNTKRGVTITLVIMFLLICRYAKLLTIGNTALIVVGGIILDRLTQRNSNKNPAKAGFLRVIKRRLQRKAVRI
jgi:hypothetical protein